MTGMRSDLALGLGCALAGGVALAVWIPADVDTGVIDVWRRQVNIGDAMMPTVAAAGLTLAGLITAGLGARAPKPAIRKPRP